MRDDSSAGDESTASGESNNKLNLSTELRHVHYNDYLSHSMNQIVKPATANLSDDETGLVVNNYPSLELR